MIEVSEFPELADRHRIRSVPHIVINDRVAFTGSMPESMFLEQVKAALAPPPAAAHRHAQ